jgi:4-methylaminobutanoate oxidase (formaldehyde-forming)
MRTDDLQGALWIPGDGKANPADLCMSLAKGARNRGAQAVEGVQVTGVISEHGRVTGVRTAQGEVRCETLINCAGQWARQFGALAGVNVPLYPAEHFYIVTDRIEGVHPMLPVMRDPDGFIYYKEEVGGLVMGGFEPVAKPWAVDPIPADFQFQLLDEDWDQFEILMTNAIHRTPCLETAPVKMLLNGPESFTPDGNFILGEAPGLRGYFVCAGFNSAGIANSGGAGQLMAEWIVAGEAPRPVGRGPPPLRRLHRQPPRAGRAHGETLGLHYAMRWPRQELQTRPAAAHLAAVRPAGRARRRVRQQERLGTRQRTSAPPAPRPRARPGHARLAAVDAAPSSAPRARPWRCTTRPPSASCCCRAATRWRCCSACAPTSRRGAGPHGLHRPAQRAVAASRAT